MLTILIPCYNEKNTIIKIISKIKKQKIKKQIKLLMIVQLKQD